MKKFIYSLFVALFLLSQFPSSVSADSVPCSDSAFKVSVSGLEGVQLFQDEVDSLGIDVNTGQMDKGKYQVLVYDTSWAPNTAVIGASETFDVEDSTGTVKLTIRPAGSNTAFNFNSTNAGNSGIDTKHVYIYRGIELFGSAISQDYCKLGTYDIKETVLTCSSPLIAYQNREIDGKTKKCYSYKGAGCLEKNVPVKFEVSGVKLSDGTSWNGSVLSNYNEGAGGINDLAQHYHQVDSSGNASWEWSFVSEGTKKINLYGVKPAIVVENRRVTGACAETSLSVSPRCADVCLETPPSNVLPTMNTYELCKQILDTTLQGECIKCATTGEGGENGQGGIWTAVGCISRDPVGIAKRLIQVGLGLGGGVALIMTLAGGFILSTSQGDPQKANQAKEIITNSVIGLLFVIFSVVILQFIGVTILRIPGFGTDTEQTP
jgi:hypothetical protein